jgi:hypothetical protein
MLICSHESQGPLIIIKFNSLKSMKVRRPLDSRAIAELYSLARRLLVLNFLDGPGWAVPLDHDNPSAIAEWKDWLTYIKIVPMH